MKEDNIAYQIRLHKRLFKRLLLFYMKKHDCFGYAINDALEAFEWLADFKYEDLYTHFDEELKA